MKTILRSLYTAAIACAASIANAATYEGSWTNTTFDTTGALTIELDIDGTRVSGSFDLDGNVFGAFDPAAIEFNARLKNGKGSFKRTDPQLGSIEVTFDDSGNLDILINNVPGGFIDEVRVDGKFDLNTETFDGTYEIDSSPGNLLAEGLLEAHVKKAPVIKGKKKVGFKGKSGKTTVKVISNVKITSQKVKASNGAKAKLVKKGNNYILKVKKLKKAGSKVKVTLTNADDLKKSKIFKFKKKG
ncbi:MAG: hypothetical protein H7A48_03135 [Akkermansiaceae bacterium]|nr:hypothetical protein [Akkermansiaceae bacterium]MCP5546958.1 hypothetical protein [Akkermansiaceae bacterium]